MTKLKSKPTCTWPGTNPLMIAYHDTEWGMPTHDDRKHFEFLVLEAAQAGLSWSIVLGKREGYRKAFSQFDPKKVARYDSTKLQKLLLDSEIIRNRLKIQVKKRGFKFVGSTVIYAHMQAVGMVNDHLVKCFRHQEVQS